MARGGQSSIGKYSGYFMAAARFAWGGRSLVKGIQKEGLDKKIGAHQHALTTEFVEANGRIPDSSEAGIIGTAATSLGKGKDITAMRAALGLDGGPGGSA